MSIKLNTLLVFILAICIASVLTYMFFPGFMSYDSLSQFSQTTGITPMSDGHPVVMVYLWRALLNISSSPGVMLAFHQLFYWLGIALFVCLLTPRLGVRLAILFMLGFCPPLLILTLHLWKDVGMLCGLILATAALLTDIKRPSYLWIVMALVGLFYAAAVRLNGFIPALPILLYLCYRVGPRLSVLRVRRIGQTCVLFVFVCLTHASLMKLLNRHSERTFAIGVLLVWDMVAISLDQNKDLVPPYLVRYNKTDFLVELRKSFSAEANYPSYETVGPMPPKDKEAELIKDWLRLIFKYPFSYLKHRMNIFIVLLNAKDRPVYYPLHPGIDKNDLGIKFSTMSENTAVRRIRFLSAVTRTIFYRTWLYFLLGLAVLFICCRKLNKLPNFDSIEALAAVVVCSGLATLGSLFVIATAADYRYVVWVSASALLAGLMLFFGREVNAVVSDER